MNGPPQKIKRLSFPEDEARNPWVALLLSAYAIFDLGVDTAVKREEKRGRTLACQEGCSSCCTTHKDIPLYPIERRGINWFVTEKLLEPYRTELRERLLRAEKHGRCPFLTNAGSCIIHVIRPAACRQFNVFGRSCAEGEDAYHTRRDDVLTPIKEYTDAAFMTILPYHGIVSQKDKEQAIRTGLLHDNAVNLKEVNWTELVQFMVEFDRKVMKEQSASDSSMKGS
jgi:Fe-S-cluster containining protein